MLALENFILAVEAVIPMFCLMFIGVLVKHYRLLTGEELAHMNRLVFTVFFSVMMFYSIYTADISAAFQPDLILFGICGVLGVYAVTFAVVIAVEKENRRRGAMIHAVYRSNFVLMGVPLVGNIFGMGHIGVATMMIAVIVPIYNILAVFTLETFRGGKFSLVKICLGVAKNPMILGALAAAAALALSVKIPAALLKPLGQITAAATPLALIILGASFTVGSTSCHRGALLFCVLAKLVAVPAVCLGAAAFLGFRGIEFVTLIAIFCTPCAVASFAMAQQMDSDAELAGNCVVFTSGLSCFTIFLWLVFFKYEGMF